MVLVQECRYLFLIPDHFVVDDCILCRLQETRIRASEKDPQSKVQNICISNQYGGEEVTHTLATESREDTHRWMEAYWQHFYDMSKYLLCSTSLLF